MKEIILTEEEFLKLINKLKEYKSANKFLNDQIREYSKKFGELKNGG